MKSNRTFFKMVCSLAIPVAIQSMLQSSFSIIDQIMIGQLGSISIAGVGLASKFSSIFSVVVSAVGAVAGIMIAQYIGGKNYKEIRKSFYVNLFFAGLIAAIFLGLCTFAPQQIMGLYTKESKTCQAAAEYLAIIGGTFLPMAGATMFATLFRCIEKAQYPLYASILSALLNTGLNYILIFGKYGFSPMGAKGAAIATVIAQWGNLLFMLLFMSRIEMPWKKKMETDIAVEDDGGLHRKAEDREQQRKKEKPFFSWRQYFSMLLPILICEVLWSLGENVYAIIYGHMGTDAAAAMTLTNPIQGLLIGALCGLSQAAGVIIGKMLGNKEYDAAYDASKKLILYGAVGACILSLLVVITAPFYMKIYQVEDSVKVLTRHILYAYALVAPFKVLNMILGGGIIRSGGKTTYILVIDTIGTWGFGVPLGLLGAFVLNLTIPYVYFLLSLEECVRFAISLVVFRRRSWMQSLE